MPAMTEPKLIAGNANRPLALAIARRMSMHRGMNVSPVDARVERFNDQEIFVEVYENVRGEDMYIVQPTSNPANDNLMELLIIADALRRSSADRITAVIPYFGYARQDRRAKARTPISAKLVANLLTQAGIDRVLTLDLHATQIQGFFDGPVDHLQALPILAAYVAEKYEGEDLAVVSPDAGRIKVAEQWSKRLDGAPLAFIHKTRDVTQPNQSVANRVVGDVKGRLCILIDDMIDTGGTICKAADALVEAGAEEVIIAATHGILSDPAAERLAEAPVSEVILTNTLPIAPEKMLDKITVLSIAPLIARAIKEIFEDGSVTSMFDGHA